MVRRRAGAAHAFSYSAGIANIGNNNQNTQFDELNCLNSLICLHFLKNIPPQNAGFGRFWLHCCPTEGAGVDRETIRFFRLPRWVSLSRSTYFPAFARGAFRHS